MRLAFVILLCFTFVAPALAQKSRGQQPQRQAKITGIYSNLEYVKEAGDVVGVEIFIVYGGDEKYYATVQVAQGWPEPPMLVSVKVNGSNIEFALPDQAGSYTGLGKYTGRVTAQGLSGKFEKEKEKIFLKRKQSFWQ